MPEHSGLSTPCTPNTAPLPRIPFCYLYKTTPLPKLLVKTGDFQTSVDYKVTPLPYYIFIIGLQLTDLCWALLCVCYNTLSRLFHQNMFGLMCNY